MDAQTAANREMVRRKFEEIWIKGNYDYVYEYTSEDFVGHMPDGEVHGPDGLKRYVIAWLSAWSDRVFHLEDIISEDDRVLLRWTMDGTHTGTIRGIFKPTGRRVTIKGWSIMRTSGGTVVESWAMIDRLGMMFQLGPDVMTQLRDMPPNKLLAAATAAVDSDA